MPPQRKKPGPRSRRVIESPVWVKAAACADCLFFDGPASGALGTCHRKPPRVTADGGTRWPVVREQEWCGDFKR